LNDLVSYNEKHNLANGEDNNDGESHNRSWNCGVEGETDDPAVKALRERQKRNFLTTLFLSQGVPMLSAGDELGRTQNGNNNAYCHDSELSWINWEKADKDLLEFTKKLIHLYKEHNVFSRRDWFKGQSIKGEGLHDIGWFSPEGKEMTEENWKQDFAKALGVYLNGHGIHAMDYNGEPIIDDSFYVIFNAHNEPLIYKLPPPIYGNNWIKILDTSKNLVSEKGGRTYKANSRIKVDGFSVVLLKQPQQEK
jgi:glycogen operon protein